MKIRRERYQHGAIRKLKRANGFAWEFRYRVTENGKRKLKSQIFDGAVYRTEKAVRQKIEAQLLRLNDGTEYARGQQVTFNALLDRYIDEEMPERHATKGGYVSIIERHLRPRWGAEPIMAIRPADLHAWFQSLKLAPVTKGHVRSLLHKLFDLATLWEYMPLERRNPVDIVKIRNVTQRVKEAVVLTPEQFRTIAPKLPGHVNMIAITAACLGLRVSEALGLQWGDIDWELQTVTIRRSAYRGAIDDTKNAGSKAKLPLHPALAELLLAWKQKCKAEWLFANPLTGMPAWVTK
jgi:integrase